MTCHHILLYIAKMRQNRGCSWPCTWPRADDWDRKRKGNRSNPLPKPEARPQALLHEPPCLSEVSVQTFAGYLNRILPRPFDAPTARVDDGITEITRGHGGGYPLCHWLFSLVINNDTILESGAKSALALGSAQ
jgi:hypothetical protein